MNDGLGKKRRRITRQHNKPNDIEAYADVTLAFKEWCDEHQLNFRRSMMIAMRLYRMLYFVRMKRRSPDP